MGGGGRKGEREMKKEKEGKGREGAVRQQRWNRGFSGERVHGRGREREHSNLI